MSNEMVRAEFKILPSEELEKGLKAIKTQQNIVKSQLVDGLDFGIIPGTGNKPTLYKPGAEKLAKLHGLADTYEIAKEQENWETGLFYYLVKCKLLFNGNVVSEGIGSCSTYEGKYRWRWVFESDVPKDMDKETMHSKSFTSKAGKPYKKYRMENDDIFSQINTVLKMAKKRAMVDATLSACRLSSVFTQDIEDFGYDDNVHVEEGEAVATAKPVKPATKVDSVKKIDGTKISPKQQKMIFAKLNEKEINKDVFKKYLDDTYHIDSTSDIVKGNFDDILKWIEG